MLVDGYEGGSAYACNDYINKDKIQFYVMGLKQVKGITKKYHGEMGIATGNGQFQIKLFMHI